MGDVASSPPRCASQVGGQGGDLCAPCPRSEQALKPNLLWGFSICPLGIHPCLQRWLQLGRGLHNHTASRAHVHAAWSTACTLMWKSPSILPHGIYQQWWTSLQQACTRALVCVRAKRG